MFTTTITILMIGRGKSLASILALSIGLFARQRPCLCHATHLDQRPPSILAVCLANWAAQSYLYQISRAVRGPAQIVSALASRWRTFGGLMKNACATWVGHHPQLETIHLFPAVPPPIAILCGRELMPKVDPALRVYDFRKKQGGFDFVLEVNKNDGRMST